MFGDLLGYLIKALKVDDATEHPSHNPEHLTHDAFYRMFLTMDYLVRALTEDGFVIRLNSTSNLARIAPANSIPFS